MVMINKITQIEYGKTFNTGGYTSLRIAVTVKVDPTSTPDIALQQAKEWVTKQYCKHKPKSR